MQDDVARLRHSIRGTINAMVLGVAALELDLPPDESMEFLTDIEKATDHLSAMLDEYEPMLDATEVPTIR